MSVATALVAGGGVGGLAAAIALAQEGMTVTVLEKAAQSHTEGAGIVLWPNGAECLDRLGIREDITQRVAVGTPPAQHSVSGRKMGHMDPGAFQVRFGDVVALHRGVLLDALARHARRLGVEIRYGTGVTHASETGHVTTSGGDLSADLVVGADGIGSAVRRSTFPDHPGPRGTGITAWRWMVDITDTELPTMPQASHTLGVGMEFGIVPVDSRRIYCFASSARRRDGSTPSPKAYRSWHAPIEQLVAAGEQAGMLSHELADLPPLATFTRGRVALLGDAAHAMTPHLGQGGSQALEDAVVLGAAVRHHRDIHAALAEYEHARMARTHALQTGSRRAMQVVATRSPTLCAVRDLAIRLIPGKISLNTLGAWATTDHLPSGRD